jgi:hypothetical protein
MARLDWLGRAKEVAQIGAAIGREFSHALLTAVVRKPEAELVSALDRCPTIFSWGARRWHRWREACTFRELHSRKFCDDDGGTLLTQGPQKGPLADTPAGLK